MTRAITALSTSCREWPAARSSAGYGQRWVGGKLLYVHRWVIETAGEDQYGNPWDPALMVMHLCDNPPCFRFDHLQLGTAADNYYDMQAKGRRLVKLRPAQVREIRRRRAAGETLATIGADYDVSESMVSLIALGKKWSHVS